MTVADALHSAAEQLTTAGVESAVREARLLLAWVLKARREDLVREPERVLTAQQELVFAKAISLRVLRRPLPYITGEQWFYGRPFKLNRAVLIPRPETEHLVEAALRVCRGISHPSIADIGTGSGILAVTLAAERPDARVWATDLSANALNVARKNAARHSVSDRVTLAQGDLLAALPPEMRFHVIVSNPPYVTEAERTHLQPEVRDYEPVLALSGVSGATGADGTELHRRLLDSAPQHLHPGGSLLLEVGQGQAHSTAAYAQGRGYAAVEREYDLGGIARVVLAQLK